MSENDLVNIFIAHLKELRFNIYPEYKNWDLVIERNGHIAGVEAKTEVNTHLLAQLCQKDDVHVKIALLPLLFDNRRQNIMDWILIARRLKILPIEVADPIRFPRANPIQIYHEVRNLFYYRHHPKNLIKLPDFKYDTPAGVQSPRKVSARNIALVKLEIFAVAQGGYVSLGQIRSFGFRQPPREYYDYDWDKKSYKIFNVKRASKDFPHIYKGILESGI